MLELQHIFKSFEGKPLLNDISLTLSEGETICLLGASGSGKSTLLRIIAGLEELDAGSIVFDNINLASTPPHIRDFGLVFQDYALFPHLNVNDNVAFGLKMRRMEQDYIAQRVVTSLDLVNLSGFGERRVIDLSGGEQQRVALARALAISPRLLMFDEPLSALDRSLRENLLNELRIILHQTKIPVIYVTHDQEEAFTIADRVLILHNGQIVRVGTPADVWSNPGSVFVAEFLSLGNIIGGVFVGKNEFQAELGNFSVNCGHGHSMGDKVNLLVRPLPVKEEANFIGGEVSDIVFQHERYKVVFESGLYVHLFEKPELGEKIMVNVKVECLQ